MKKFNRDTDGYKSMEHKIDEDKFDINNDGVYLFRTDNLRNVPRDEQEQTRRERYKELNGLGKKYSKLYEEDLIPCNEFKRMMDSCKTIKKRK